MSGHHPGIPNAGLNFGSGESFHSVADIAALLKVNQKTIRRRTEIGESGEIVVHRIGSWVLTRDSDLAAFIKQHRGE